MVSMFVVNSAISINRNESIRKQLIHVFNAIAHSANIILKINRKKENARNIYLSAKFRCKYTFPIQSEWNGAHFWFIEYKLDHICCCGNRPNVCNFSSNITSRFILPGDPIRKVLLHIPAI